MELKCSVVEKKDNIPSVYMYMYVVMVATCHADTHA